MKNLLILLALGFALCVPALAQNKYDLNADGDVNVGDVTTLVNIILGKTPVPERGTGWSVPPTTSDGRFSSYVQDEAGTRLASIIGFNGGMTMDVDEDGGIGRVESWFHADGKSYEWSEFSKKSILTYTLNGQGLISTTKIVSQAYNDDKLLTDEESTYTYDSEGHLTKVVTVNDMSGDYGFTFIEETTTTYTWESGDLVSCEKVSKSTMDETASKTSKTFEYGKDENPLLCKFWMYEATTPNYMAVLTTLGYFGKGSRHLLKKVSFSDGDQWNISITLRSDGTVAKEDVGGWLTYEPMYAGEPIDLSGNPYDLNNDGSVNVGDVTTLVNRILGKTLDDPEQIDPLLKAVVCNASGKQITINGKSYKVTSAFGQTVRSDNAGNILQVGNLALKKPGTFLLGDRECDYFFNDGDKAHLLSMFLEQTKDGVSYTHSYDYDANMRLTKFSVSGYDPKQPSTDYSRIYQIFYGTDGALLEIHVNGHDFNKEGEADQVTRRYVFSGNAATNQWQQFLPLGILGLSHIRALGMMGYLGNGPTCFPAKMTEFKLNDAMDYEEVNTTQFSGKTNSDGLLTEIGGLGSVTYETLEK